MTLIFYCILYLHTMLYRIELRIFYLSQYDSHMMFKIYCESSIVDVHPYYHVIIIIIDIPSS